MYTNLNILYKDLILNTNLHRGSDINSIPTVSSTVNLNRKLEGRTLLFHSVRFRLEETRNTKYSFLSHSSVDNENPFTCCFGKFFPNYFRRKILYVSTFKRIRLHVKVPLGPPMTFSYVIESV